MTTRPVAVDTSERGRRGSQRRLSFGEGVAKSMMRLVLRGEVKSERAAVELGVKGEEGLAL